MRDWDSKISRISLDLTQAEKAQLEGMVKDLGTRTQARLIRQALNFYAVLIKHKKAGYLIQAIKGGSLLQFPELDVPYPEDLSPRKHWKKPDPGVKG